MRATVIDLEKACCGIGIKGVDPWQVGDAIGLIGAKGVDCGTGGESCVLQDVGTKGTTVELGEEGFFVAGDLEALEVVEVVRNGGYNFLRKDQLPAQGCLYEYFC